VEPPHDRRDEALSLSLTVTHTVPADGSGWPAESAALANAMPNDSSKPITSPVERISGPRMMSTSNLLNGSTPP
jgi:hypothetical protein